MNMPAIDYSRVAHFYDAYVNTDFDVSFFLNEAKEAPRVLELMSGTGRLSIPLIESGVQLTCVDNSPDMLALLRKKLVDKKLSACVHEMDVCDLALKGPFDLIIIAFHAFAEILGRDDQRKALAGIQRLLITGGRFICTLHNPPVRLKSVNGKLSQRGKYLLPDQGTLFLSAIQHYDAANQVVNGTQFYEAYDAFGEMESKSFADIQFYLHQKDEFEELVKSEGFSILDLYGDYSHSQFGKDKSPFMIWKLGNASGPRKRD